MWGHLACQVNSFLYYYIYRYSTVYSIYSFFFPFLFEVKILCVMWWWWCYPSRNYVCFIFFYLFRSPFFFLLAQVSGSKLWQTERSCMCCQESGEREATVSLLCPKAAPGEPKLRRVNKINKKGWRWIQLKIVLFFWCSCFHPTQKTKQK